MTSVIILAAGDGSRLKSNTPKVFHKIGGLSLLEHIIRSAKKINPAEIIAVLKPQYKDVELEGCVKKAFQEIPKGSGDAVKSGINVMRCDDNGWVYILYADIPLISNTTLAEWRKVAQRCDKTAVVVLAMDSSESENLGKLEPSEEQGTIRSIIEAKDASKVDKTIPLCNAGLLVRKRVLKQLIDKIKPSAITGEFYITEIVRLAFDAGYICRYYEGNKNELIGANTRVELSILEKNFQDKMRRKHMENGVTLIAPETVFFSYDTKIEKDVVIHPYVIFSTNVYIKTGAEIGSFCVVEGANICKAKVGPFTRLRAGSEVQDGARIGNFVEIKNSIISEKSKVNHLSYIGDSDVGKNTNIGAGTITCNYDGFKKNKTFIGENVFIGSNTSLVAPINIFDNSMVGAGSVITKDVDEDDLAIARNRQKNIKNGSVDFRKMKDKK